MLGALSAPTFACRFRVDGLRGGGIHAIVGVTGTDQPERVLPIRIKEITMIEQLFGISSNIVTGSGTLLQSVVDWVQQLLGNVLDTF